jgi:oligopeptide transport system substrate-binding protein
MSVFSSRKVVLGVGLLALALAGCSAKDEVYFGTVNPPSENVLHYVSGSEPESLDPQVSNGQPEARIYMSIFEGLTEYHPKTMEPIPAIAERWEVNSDSSEFIFHLRHNARWSNGEGITARDFVYTFRRGLSRALASRSAYLGYYIKYARAYNSGALFVRDPVTGEFLLAKDFRRSGKTDDPAIDSQDSALQTEFNKFIKSPERLVLPRGEKARNKALEANPNLKAAIAGKELVEVKAEDIGVEAVDDYTFRVTLAQPSPFFIGMMSHPFFRAVPQRIIEQYENGLEWTQPHRQIVTSGPFKIETWMPYDQLVVVRDPMYWDAEHVKLDRIIFYPVDQNHSIMTMYKVGQVDAVANHSVPAGWLERIRSLKDYMDAPEATTEFYTINTQKPPMDDVRVRKAFNMSIDKVALAKWLHTVKPLTAFTPEGIFIGYPQPRGDEFNPQKAKQLLAEAGYKDANGNFDPNKFPIAQVNLTYNTQDSLKATAEFIQAQWQQNLGLLVSLRNMESKTFHDVRAKLEYSGFARSGWGADYMDPYSFLDVFSAPGGANSTGWSEPKYAQMLDEANYQLDPKKRYAMLAEAEAYLIEAQPAIPLYTAATNWMKKPYVKGMFPNPQTLHPWKFVYIERDPAKWDSGVPDMRRQAGEFGPDY